MKQSHPLLGNLWTTPQGHLHFDRLRREAGEQSRRHVLPASAAQCREQAHALRESLKERLQIPARPPTLNEHPSAIAGEQRAPRASCPLDVQVHGEILCAGYRIRAISFLSAPDIRVTANLYLPDGEGPFPAVLNCHGHWSEGKIAPKVQARGHALALNGMVVLVVDAAGSGERGEQERQWEYHGAAKGAELFLFGNSLLAQQVRDNMRAIDVLQALPFVQSDRIGVTGASGGGNQTMWLAAMDERVTVAVPVVSVGSFEAFVGRRNCICETLPGGLALAEEWGVLGAIAPRPLLILNALHDQPAFGYEPMTQTCRKVQEIYAILGRRHHFDWRILNMTHGYHPEALEIMLGWMKHWLCGASGSGPAVLPHWSDANQDNLLCYGPGKRPEACGFRHMRQVLDDASRQNHLTENTPNLSTAQTREGLARLVGWKTPNPADWTCTHTFADGSELGSLPTSREISIPVGFSLPLKECSGEVRFILSSGGRADDFVAAELQCAQQAGLPAITTDLPATGELNWDDTPVAGSRLHDASRACLWLGYTLVSEWAEAIAGICFYVQKQAPDAAIHIIAREETAFAALLARALAPLERVRITEIDAPESLRDAKSDSLVWMVPGFLQWGDLRTLRTAAACADASV